MISGTLSTSPGSARTSLSYTNFTLLDKSFLTGTIKNKTRIMTRFSSPGGFETLSRGFLDPAYETYSVYNALTYRNLSVREVYNTQLQAHQGRFGIGAHNTDAARVYGDEAVGQVDKLSYTIIGDGTTQDLAAKHKYHRNNIEKYVYTGDHPNPGGTDGDTISLASTNDNAFISHTIPRTENQTRWITASLI